MGITDTALEANTGAAAIAELGASSARVELYDGPTKLFCSVAGKVATIEKEVPPRADEATTVEALAMLAVEDSEVWHDGNLVTLVIDGSGNSHRLDRVTWELTTTEAWESAVKQRRGLSQKEAIELLTVALREPVRQSEQATALLEAIRLLKWSSSDEATEAEERGKSSMGKTISHKATGAGDVPELVTLAVPRWAEFDETFAVNLLVNLNADERTILIRATRDDCSRAERSAQAFLHSHLEESVGDLATIVSGRAN